MLTLHNMVSKQVVKYETLKFKLPYRARVSRTVNVNLEWEHCEDHLLWVSLKAKTVFLLVQRQVVTHVWL